MSKKKFPTAAAVAVASVLALGRDAIIAASDIQKEFVEVPEWNGGVWVRVMDGTRRGLFEEAVIKGTVNTSTCRGLLVALCCCDESGAFLFQPEDAAAVGAKSAAALDRLFVKAAVMNKISADDQEHAAKNS